MPRGFAGASGALEAIELVLVFAEPGDPQPGEQHVGLQTAYNYAYSAFETGLTRFHKNVRYILDACWPALTFAQQMEHAWLTESVLCSATKKGGTVHASTVRACGERFLSKQVQLLPNAVVAASGSKATARLRIAGITGFLEAAAVAPPGCNFVGARESWDAIARAVRAREVSDHQDA